MLKIGDKVKLRSHVNKHDLADIDLNPTTDYGVLTIVGNSPPHYSISDYITISKVGHITIPAAWLEKIIEGHPQTNIFK